MIEVIGFLAATLTTIAFLPQALLVIRTGSTKDLSPIMYSMFVSGVLMWLIYGLMLGNTVIVFANGITAILSGIVFFYVLKNKVFCRVP